MDLQSLAVAKFPRRRVSHDGDTTKTVTIIDGNAESVDEDFPVVPMMGQDVCVRGLQVYGYNTQHRCFILVKKSLFVRAKVGAWS